APRLVMSGLAFGMAASVILTGAITARWSALAIGLVAGALSATAMSWHGILLSESARLAPVGRAGSGTGGGLCFGQVGALLCPSVFALLLRVTGGYQIGWMVCAVPAILVGVNLLGGHPKRARPMTRGLIAPTKGRRGDGD